MITFVDYYVLNTTNNFDKENFYKLKTNSLLIGLFKGATDELKAFDKYMAGYGPWDELTINATANWFHPKFNNKTGFNITCPNNTYISGLWRILGAKDDLLN
jgi:hypothetical protein